MKRQNMRKPLGLLLACCALGLAVSAFAAEPQISDVALSQRGRRVIVTYRLQNAPAVVTVDFLTNTASGAWVSIGAENFTSLTKDVNCRVEPSATEQKRIVWESGRDWPHQKVDAGSFKAVVTAHSVFCPPTWMSVKLDDGKVRYYVDKTAIPGGFGDERYKTTHVLLRKIPAACDSFRMGQSAYGESTYNTDYNEDPHLVSFTNDWYMAVYETTQSQYERVMGTNPTTHKDPLCPVAEVSYGALRGSSGANWPTDGFNVAAGSFFGTLRARANVRFDLPTEAQWEYSCRAGTTTGLNNGKDLSGNGGTGSSFPEIEELAWCSCNATETHPVGGKLPNAWDLYDMHGNVAEICRDWFGLYTGDAIDPSGPTSGSGRITRGGSYQYYVANLRASRRTYTTGTQPNNGFRIWAEAVAR